MPLSVHYEHGNGQSLCYKECNEDELAIVVSSSILLMECQNVESVTPYTCLRIGYFLNQDNTISNKLCLLIAVCSFILCASCGCGISVLGNCLSPL